MSDAVMVPREPDDRMVKRGAEYLFDSRDKDTRKLAAGMYRAMLAASTPVGGWEDISTAPKDGTLIMTWCVHVNAEHCEDAVDEGYAGPVLAKWIDHNGGGFTWHGLAGQHTHWMPLPPPPSVSTDKGSRPQEAVPTEQAEPAVLGWKCNCCTTRFASEWTARAPSGFDEHGTGPRCPRCKAGGAYTYPYSLHEGDPCVHCGVGHDDIAPGECPGAQPADGCSSNEGADT